MVALNFPATPSNGDIYQAANGLRYQYDGTYQYWKFLTATDGDITVGGRILRTDGYEYNAVLNTNPQLDNYTLVALDAGKLVTMNAATAKAITVPANSSVAFPKGTRIDVVRIGAGELTISITTDRLRVPNNSFRLAFQNSGASLVKTNWTEWNLAGDLKV